MSVLNISLFHLVMSVYFAVHYTQSEIWKTETAFTCLDSRLNSVLVLEISQTGTQTATETVLSWRVVLVFCTVHTSTYKKINP